MCAKVNKAGPGDFGWDDYLGGGGYEHKDPMLYQRGNNRRGQGYTADLWTDFTLDFIRQHRDQPWFATVAYIIPHMPWVCDDKYSEPFIAQGCSKDLAACYGSISHLDHSIGRLLDGLRETGQEQRTIVVFLSDNGPTAPDIKSLTDADGRVKSDDWAKRNVANLRGHKAMTWENGCRVPMLIRWPGRIPAGERRQLGCAEDILPTLLDLAAVKPDIVRHHPFTGVSLRPVLEDAASSFERPAAFRIAIAGPGAPRDLPADKPRRFEDHHLTLRGPRHIFHSLPGGKSALYDLDTDPGETIDVKEKRPDLAAAMAAETRKRWDAILASGRAFVPSPDGRGAEKD
ncbi:MAG: sulfatase-like hydrolase/transferase [Verrucomicrobiota bacterium]